MIRKRVLGIGATSATLLVQDTEADGALRVLRRINVSNWPKQDIDEIYNLYTSLQQFNFPGFVHIHTVLLQNNFLNLVTSYCPGGDVLNFVEEETEDPLPERQVAQWLLAMCMAIRQMHIKKLVQQATGGNNGSASRKDRNGAAAPSAVPNLCFFGLSLERVYLDEEKGGSAGILLGIPLCASIYYKAVDEKLKDGSNLDRVFPPEVRDAAEVGQRGYHPTLSDVWHLGQLGLQLLSFHGDYGARSSKMRQAIERMMAEDLRQRSTLDTAIADLTDLAGGPARLAAPEKASVNPPGSYNNGNAVPPNSAGTSTNSNPRAPKVSAHSATVVTAPTPTSFDKQTNSTSAPLSPSANLNPALTKQNTSSSVSSVPPVIQTRPTRRPVAHRDANSNNLNTATAPSPSSSSAAPSPTSAPSVSPPAAAAFGKDPRKESTNSNSNTEAPPVIVSTAVPLARRERAAAREREREQQERKKREEAAAAAARARAQPGPGPAAVPARGSHRLSGHGNAADGNEDDWHSKAMAQFAELQRMNASPMPVRRNVSRQQQRVSPAGRRATPQRATPQQRRSIGEQPKRPVDHTTQAFNEMFAEMREQQEAAARRRQQAEDDRHLRTSQEQQEHDIRAARQHLERFKKDNEGSRSNLNSHLYNDVTSSAEPNSRALKHHLKEWKWTNPNKDSDNIEVTESDGVVIMAPRAPSRSKAEDPRSRQNTNPNTNNNNNINANSDRYTSKPKTVHQPIPEAHPSRNRGNANNYNNVSTSGTHQPPVRGYRDGMVESPKENYVVERREDHRRFQNLSAAAAAAAHRNPNSNKPYYEDDGPSSPPVRDIPVTVVAPPRPDTIPTSPSSGGEPPMEPRQAPAPQPRGRQPATPHREPPPRQYPAEAPQPRVPQNRSSAPGDAASNTLATLQWSIDSLRNSIREMMPNRALYGEVILTLSDFMATHPDEATRTSPQANEQFMRELKTLISDNQLFATAAPLCVQLIALEGLQDSVRNARRASGSGPL